MAHAAAPSTAYAEYRAYEEAIQSFEAAQAKLRVRRASASANIIVHLDRTLEMNERTLEALRRALAIASNRSGYEQS